jgi:protein-disulfide isomerase
MPSRSEIQAKRAEKQKRSRRLTILIAAGVGLVVVAFLIAPSFRAKPEIVMPEALPHPMAEGTTLGDPQAPVTIINYSDFQCVYCKRFSTETEPQLVRDFVETGKASLTFKQFAFLGQPSIDAAEASLCAEEQGEFWRYHDILFANQAEGDRSAFSNERLVAFADALGLNVGEFESCLKDHRYLDRVRQEYNDGKALEVSSTPTFLINGKLILGAQPYEVFQAEIEAALAGS